MTTRRRKPRSDPRAVHPPLRNPPLSGNVIFLDIDGVLLTVRYLKQTQAAGFLRYAPFDPEAIAVLGKICEASDAALVISSTWRMLHPHGFFSGIFEQHGCTARIIGSTPTQGSHRGTQIKGWLDRHPEVAHFVILDDEADMEPFCSHLVQTDSDLGLLPQHVAIAWDVLQLDREPAVA